MNLPPCVLCGRECIPLADYETPVCHRCDDRATAVLEVAGDVDTLRGTPTPAPSAPVAVNAVLFDDLRAWQADRKTA